MVTQSQDQGFNADRSYRVDRSWGFFCKIICLLIIFFVFLGCQSLVSPKGPFHIQWQKKCKRSLETLLFIYIDHNRLKELKWMLSVMLSKVLKTKKSRGNTGVKGLLIFYKKLYIMFILFQFWICIVSITYLIKLQTV